MQCICQATTQGKTSLIMLEPLPLVGEGERNNISLLETRNICHVTCGFFLHSQTISNLLYARMWDNRFSLTLEAADRVARIKSVLKKTNTLRLRISGALHASKQTQYEPLPQNTLRKWHDKLSLLDLYILSRVGENLSNVTESFTKLGGGRAEKWHNECISFIQLLVKSREINWDG